MSVGPDVVTPLASLLKDLAKYVQPNPDHERLRMLLLVLALGRFVDDPIVKTSQAGKLFCRFRLACPYRMGTDTKVEYVSCVVFGKAAEIVERCKKGQLIFIKGRLSTSSYTDKSGQKKWTTDVVVEEVTLADRGGDHATAEDDESTPF